MCCCRGAGSGTCLAGEPTGLTPRAAVRAPPPLAALLQTEAVAACSATGNCCPAGLLTMMAHAYSRAGGDGVEVPTAAGYSAHGAALLQSETALNAL